MKNSKWVSAALASALLITAGVGSVSAASVNSSGKTSTNKKTAIQATVKVKEGTATWTVNGTPVAFKTIDSNGYKLYSLSQVAGEMGAALTWGANGIELNDSQGLHTIQLKAGSKSYQVDGSQQTFTVAPVAYKGKIYVQLTKFVLGLGGELQTNPNIILSPARPAGEFETMHWTADGRIIANQGDAEFTQIFKFSTVQGNYETFSSDERATDFSVSPDQTWGAFTDDKGQMNLINLLNGVVKTLGTDTSVKTDLTWSQDGKKIYFIQGDKQEKISQISVETGVVTEVLADKVENKSELRISADEKTAVYIVNLTGVAKNDADSTEDSLTVDFSKAGEQLYKLALGTKDAKPVALTTTPDNKLYPEILADGSITYLSADPDGNTINTIKTIKADAAVSDLTLDIEVTWSAKVSSGLIVAGTATDGSTRIYSTTPAGSKTELYRTTKDVAEIAVSDDGSKLAIIIDGKILVIQNGKALQLTK
ncbi:WD40 repeat domain-containing protein [Paenibacillus sp. BR2-3]|uniref:stalk domain-containing protein n=1 Tax=Paenibacillus sp. BR2-3 TaxID=3048494 RepID=UPI00397792EB